MGQYIIEGSIGTSKTTFLTEVDNYFADRPQHTHILKEPVDNWTNYDGVNLLGEFNKDPKENCFKFELLAMLTMATNHGLSGTDIRNKIFIERSLFSAFEVFVKTQKTMGFINDLEYNLLKDYYLKMRESLVRKRPDLVVYLHAPPEVLLKRVQTRGRHEEGSVVTLNYLEELQKNYDMYIYGWRQKGVPVIKINTDVDNDIMIEKFRTILQSIDEFAPPRIGMNISQLAEK